jgi:predicted ATP-grasp superfamily ATP-dependent carboligase
VLNSEKRSSLALIRSLGQKDIDVTAASHLKFAQGSYSKYSKKKIMYPSPEKNVKKFNEFLLRELQKENYDVLFPMNEYTILPIMLNRKKFGKYVKLAIPENNILEKALDKKFTFKTAINNKIPCPKTYFIKNLKQLKQLSDKLEYPIVIKPRYSCFLINNQIKHFDVVYANSKEELLIKYSKLHSQSKFPLMQEYIYGNGFGFFALLNKSKPLAVFAHQRIREHPYTGGPSTFRISVDIPELKTFGLKLLRKLNWQGIAMVEFKRDRKDDQFKLMEVNGRFWGSLQLSIASGVDFPYLLYQLINNKQIKQVKHYNVGTKCRWLLPGDILHLISVLKSNKTIDLDLRKPNKLKTIKEFFRFFEKDLHYDVISLKDPLPIAANIWSLIKK